MTDAAIQDLIVLAESVKAGTCRSLVQAADEFSALVLARFKSVAVLHERPLGHRARVLPSGEVCLPLEDFRALEQVNQLADQVALEVDRVLMGETEKCGECELGAVGALRDAMNELRPALIR